MTIGRPRVRLNAVQLQLLEELAARFGGTADIAALISRLPDASGTPGPSVSKRTLQRRYGAILKKGRAHASAALQMAMWNKALAGNAQLLIHLGKVYLGQHDTVQLTGAEGQPLLPAPVADKTVVVVVREEAESPITLEALNREYGFYGRQGNGANSPAPPNREAVPWRVRS